MSRQPPDHVELDDEALKAVANETRLRIIASLGAVVRDGRYGTRRFSELMEQIGLSDSGQTTYHLDRLREQGYVERTEEGYRLTLRGLRIYQFVRSGVLSGSEAVGPFELDLDHEECGKPLSIRYEDHRVYGECEHCDEIIGVNPVRPSGFDPSRPESVADAYRHRFWMDNFAMTQGFCPYCSGDVQSKIDYRHTEAVPDDAQGSDPAITFTCSICHWFISTTIEFPGYLHPAVVAFCYEHGLNIREHNPLKLPIDIPEYDVRSEDPWRVAVTYAYEGDSITLTFDDDLTVHEIEREASPMESDASP
ncbi:winged helix-turn-helix domain-containing protein [Halobellus sp. EA9]|uniref:winged helix-turn-helix domain-containing protein n=1 Tax=Halobellus sp. EA9 TaxID=3421647 RepID=UPI003EB75649